MTRLIPCTALVLLCLSSCCLSKELSEVVHAAQPRGGDSTSSSSDGVYTTFTPSDPISQPQQTFSSYRPTTYSSEPQFFIPSGHQVQQQQQQGLIQGGNLISYLIYGAIGLALIVLAFQLVTKIVGTDAFDKLFKGRALDTDELALLTNMAMNAIEKYTMQLQEEEAVPK